MIKYAIVATKSSALAQYGQAQLIEYESDYYNNFISIASGSFHEMSKLAKKLNSSVK